MTCPLCLNNDFQHYHQDKIRDYWQCAVCLLVFVKPEQYVTAQQEKAVYDQHQNSPDDRGYRQFLNKLLIPLTQRLKSNAIGLDFGSGPGPTISIMLKEQGFAVYNYDVYYANNSECLTVDYDFITCTEVLEHLHHPHKEISMLTKMLKKDAYLGIMTKRVIDKDRFKNWHYKNDLTHVCFYSIATFEYIAEYWCLTLDVINSDTVIFKA
ncbi:MAG: class I SAM-dependent methyltransferase [Alcanivoracaceae bacterium]|nr:class I SAM-dependent methyltransferase [Alcanivoracaceae bacterium]